MSEMKGKPRQMPGEDISAPEGALSQGADRRTGLLKRLFQWLAKGANESRTSRTSCST